MNTRIRIFTLCALIWGVLSAWAQGNTLTIPDVTVAPGRSVYLPIQMNNTSNVVGVQFTLTVQNGITLDTSTATLTERADGHTMKFSKTGTNQYMAVIFSPENKPFIGRAGDLITVKLTASASLKEGFVSPMTLSEVVLGAPDGSNISTGHQAGRVLCAKSPDLEVSNVSFSGNTLSPQGTLSLNWQVSNIGGISTGPGWSEHILLETAGGTVKELGTVYYDQSLSAGGVVSRNADITVPFVLGIDGDAFIRVRLVPNRDTGETEGLQHNNSAFTSSAIRVEKALKVSPENAEVDEAEESLVKFLLTRSGDTTKEGSFTIAKNSDSRIQLPESVTIPAGQSGVVFYAQIKANNIMDGDSEVTINISGTDYGQVSAQLSIDDDILPNLGIESDAQDVEEGQAIKFRITTERASSNDIALALTCDLPKRFDIPSDIKIPAGETEVEVTVTAKDDDVPNVEEVVTFTVTAARHNPASMNTVLTDNDVPTLQLEITPSAISESAGPLAITAKLKRTDNIDKVVTVKLSDDSEGNLYYGRQSIVMEKGVEEVTLNLGPLDNSIVDGERTYNISAAVWIASCSCNANNGTSGGVVTVPLTIYDNDGPTLTMTSAASVLKEGGEMTVTVKHNTVTVNPVTVNLSCDHETDIEFPQTVNIPAGKNEVSFTVKSKANDITNDGYIATLKATSEGFATGNIIFTVSDQTLPDAQITELALSEEEVAVGETLSVEVAVTNTGTYELPEQTKIGIYTNYSSTAIATLYLQKALPEGETIVLQREIVLPSAIGTFNVYAIANDGNDVKELCYTNNSSKIRPVRTVSPYTVTIHSDKSVYNPGETVKFSGFITGNEVAGQDVEVYVINDNYRHILKVKTDDAGAFCTDYTPYTGQMGHFVAGACYPKEGLYDEMLAFDFYGVKRVPNKAITCEVLLGETYSGTYQLVNPGNLSLNNVSVEVLSKPHNCNISVTCPDHIDANSSIDVAYQIDATAVSEGYDWQGIKLMLRTEEGVSYPTTLYYYCRNKQGQLRAEVTRIKTTMLKGTSRDYPFQIINTGEGETGTISVEIPSWMNTVTPREMASLEYGESATIILRLTPTEDMQINVPISGSIGINCENGQGLSLPFYIEPVSESTGTMTIDVCDENTYYTAEQPHLEGATVTVSHPTTGAKITSGTTGKDGIFQAVLPEGYYAVSVSAPNHTSYRNNLLVDPGIENTTVVNLSIEAITIDWKVEETTVQDEYKIVSTVKYETNVPVPVVELSVPQSIDAKALPEGESLIFYATLTNKGLITAEDVQLELPTGFKALEFEALSNNEPFNLAPQQSVLIPVKVSHISTSSSQSMARIKPIDDDPCVGQPGTLYYWDCGLDRKWHRYKVSLQLGSCNSNDSTTWDNNGNGTYGGGIYRGGGYRWRPSTGPGANIGGSNIHFGSSTNNSAVSTDEDQDCEPCQNKFLIDLVDCGLQLIPAYKVLKEVLNCVGSIRNLIETTKKGNVKDIAYGTLEATTSCIAAKRAGAGDKNTTRQAERQQALEDILMTLSQLKAQQSQGESLDGEGIIETLVSLASSLATLAGWDFDNVEKILCPVKLFLPCEYEGDDNGESGSTPNKAIKSKVTTDTTTPSYIIEFRQNLAFPFIQQLTLIGLRYEFFGDADWMNVEQDQLYTFFDTFTASQNPEGLVSEENYETLIDAKPESISRHQVIKFIERWNNSLSQNTDEPHFDCNKIAGYYDMIASVNSAIVDKGFESVAELYESSFEKCKSTAEESKSVCASITLQFSQQMVMTRQAFRGTLTVFNGNETTAMTDVKLTLEVKDADGNLATSHEFQINPESLTGFEGQLDLGDGWTLGANETGVATILFIPTKYAAPMVEKPYSFGGTLSYVDPFTGLTVTRTLAPVVLTVKPSPNLDLTYFMQRDIKGDDPLTEAIEPCEEAEFSLLINNTGYGDATDVRMYTEQPQIIENEKGLLIDFELISSQLNGGEKTLALGGTVATDFGTIPAKSTAYAQWWIKSSLLGHFTDYDIEATHVTSYGNPDLSLLNEVTIHELIRSIDANETDTKVIGFLANDIVDAEDTPDMLYLSNGEVEKVFQAQTADIQKISDTDYMLKVIADKSGWNYGNITDPTYGVSTLKRVVRQRDGKDMSLRNFWQTDCTLRDGKDPLYENRIHFADDMDAANNETYILTFEPVPELILEVASFENVPEEGSLSTEPLEHVKVIFNKTVNPSTFSSEDISLAVQGVKQDISSIGISTDDNKTFTLDLTGINETIGNGYFVLTVNTSGITDSEGYLGKNGKQTGWIMFRDGLVELNSETYPKSAGTIQKQTVPSRAVAQASTEQIEDKATYGSTIRLTTIPNEGYIFKNWTINGEIVSTEKELEYVALNDMDIKANYSLKTYAVNIAESDDGGTISGAASGVYSYGDVLKLAATAHEDFVFDGWMVNGKLLGHDNKQSVVVDEVKDIKAIFRREIFHQALIMERGWNWISTFVNDTIPINELPFSVTHIISQFDETIDDPVYGMTGGIDMLLPGVAYKMKTAYSVMKSFKGHLYNLTDAPIELHSGWNWISYPYVEERNLNEVLVNASEGDYITSQLGFAEYMDGNWEGTLTYFTPGCGYIYKSGEDKVLEFDFTQTTSEATAMRASATGYDISDSEIDVHKYPSTMNIIAQVTATPYDIDDSQCCIYAFAGNECRGKSKYIGGKHYLTVYGDDATGITFVIENTSNGNTYIANESLNFRQDVIGSRKSPFILTLSGPTEINSINGEGHRLKIYTPDGRLVGTDATAEALKTLRHGIYIINGQKFMVK